jgi:hypothetical protein
MKKGIVYYTDNSCEERIVLVCRRQIQRCTDMPITSVSHYPIDFGTNIVVSFPRAVLSIFKQILIGLKHTDADVVFLLEHDMLYPPEHFEFVPRGDNVFWYNRTRWSVCNETGKAVFYHTNVPSTLCANRDLLIDHYSRVVDFVEKNGWKSRYGYSPPKGLPKELLANV